MKFLNDFSEMFVRNNEFTWKIYAVNCKYASLNTYDLVNVVHAQPHPFIKGKTINDVGIGHKILYGLSSEKAKLEFEIKPEELATIEVYLDTENYNSIMSAIESAKRKPLLRMNEVF